MHCQDGKIVLQALPYFRIWKYVIIVATIAIEVKAGIKWRVRQIKIKKQSQICECVSE